ncbi:MAG: phosphate ABC transporter permease PstA [Deltaproteobacteria bacterium]|nr:phosphate ABC transporter permease PstA [Deltaproteobacteria bacterium]
MSTSYNKFWKSGDPFIWMTGGALALSLIMIISLIVIVAANALGYYWPDRLVQVTLKDGTEILGQQIVSEPIPTPDTPTATTLYRTEFQVANRDLYGADFRWVNDDEIVARSFPADALLFERWEWGPLFGHLSSVTQDGKVIAEGFAPAWKKFQELHPRTQETLARIHRIERKEIGDINYRLEQVRLEMKGLQRQGQDSTPDAKHLAALEQEITELQRRYEEKAAELKTLYDENARYRFLVKAAGGKDKELPVAAVVRAFLPNQLSWWGRFSLYVTRLVEFVWEEPRESNTEGGVFPAIFGTVIMVLIMSVMVVPFGVIAALYLREYAKQGPMVRAVRIAVNNLAGVPSIVFGVFGLGFFVYLVGGSIDRLFYPEALPTPTYGTGGILWASLTLALLTVPVVIVATEESLSAIPREWREGSLALGATKWETIRKIVLPGALPGILTGMILAMARGAGEVAPLMITGVVKLAPTLPLDAHAPFFHLERKFMHLGFHIYDVGFQSPNVEAAKPMVFMTTLLLIGIILLLNLTAIVVRNRLRSRLRFGTF